MLTLAVMLRSLLSQGVLGRRSWEPCIVMSGAWTPGPYSSLGWLRLFVLLHRDHVLNLCRSGEAAAEVPDTDVLQDTVLH